MKFISTFVLGLTVLILFSSCAPTYESKGDSAYRAAQNAAGDKKRRLLKEAYLYYLKAFKAHPNKINMRARNRFIEMTLVRANMVLVEGSSEMDAIPLFMEEIDNIMTQEVDPKLKSDYASFIVSLADSNLSNQKIYKGLDLLGKAIDVAVDKAPIQKRRDDVIANLSKDNLEIAKMELENAMSNKDDHESLIRAEYRTLLSLYYDKDSKEAIELLSKIREKNISNYSAFEAVVTDKPDSNIYDQINEYDILLAVPSKLGDVVMVNMYNYSYNPLRLFPESFALVDVNGKRYPALKSSKIEKEILDQECEIKMTLRFPPTKAKVKKIIFESENKEHYTEKNFF